MSATFCFLALNNNATAYAGDSIKGYVIVLITEGLQGDGSTTAEPVQSVAVDWSGVEETVWFDGVKQDQRHGAQRAFTSDASVLWSASEEDDERAALDVGTHTFPFELTLNASLPSSFEDSGLGVGLFSAHDFMPKSFGKSRPAIRFTVNALINQRQSASHALRVWQRVSLPPIATAAPLVVTQSKTFLLGKHPVELTVSLPHNGHCFLASGVTVRVTVANNGTRKVDDVRLTLGDVVLLRGANAAEQMSRHSAVAVQTLPSSAVAPGQMWTRDVTLDIPADASPSIRSKLIQHTYELVVDVNAGLGSTLTASLPIVIWGGSEALSRTELLKL